jgi:cytochrome c oxidase subunit 1
MGLQTEVAHAAAHDAHHEELGFWRKYVFSVDHKVIGIQYAITGLLFLFFGFCLMMLMRWQLAYPGAALPILGTLLGESRMPGGTMLPEFYNELGAMHGTIMVFLGVVPLAVGGFGTRPPAPDRGATWPSLSSHAGATATPRW